MLFRTVTKVCWNLMTVALILFSNTTLSAAGEKSFSIEIDSQEAEYTIDVQGTANPENIEIVIENLGAVAVESPRITVNGKYDWFDMESMVGEITAGCTTDEEKAMAIWQWVHWKRFQRSPFDRSSLHPVRAMNGYGYGICGHTAAWLKALFTQAGLKARVQEIWGHTISEVYFDGGWHMVDGNVKVFYLGRDNRTIASLAELEQDGWLIERTIHPRDPWVRQDDSPGRNKEFVRYIVTSGDNFEEHSYDSEIKKTYTMGYSLKPGEKLERWWQPVLEKFEGRSQRAKVPQKYANGRLSWEPDLAKIDILDYLNVIENVTTSHQDGVAPAIHVAELQNDNYTRAARFTIPVKSAYPVVGGKFYCTLRKDQGASAQVFYGTPAWSNANLHSFRWGFGQQNVELYLDNFILDDSSHYGYEIGFTIAGNGRNGRSAQAGVEKFKSVTDLQVSPHSLPALSLGRNVIRYRDSSPSQGRKVRITHRWKEAEGNSPPKRIIHSEQPAGGQTVATLAPVLRWKSAGDPDGVSDVTDYQVMVSLRPDCRWPVSMSLYRNVGSAESQWQVPDSFLNPATSYYWRVRARDTSGAVGEWGDVFSFETAADAR